eukprot:gnl/Chilomastix_cuspidata/931.p1 GENE.gnl/Chilomastix_cuspidata/931~~gnl/Chilomastix_cuspidata/931.p1  ORF type:complete len:490 (+),score=196.53 gnl/Chilomastix_cuspidata/931:35-1504(+)
MGGQLFSICGKVLPAAHTRPACRMSESVDVVSLDAPQNEQFKKLRYTIFGFSVIALLTILLVLIGTLLKLSDENEDVSFPNGLYERFKTYVEIDTQSSEETGTSPSTDGQWVLAEQIAYELDVLGLEDVEVSEFGIVYATLPARGYDGDLTIGFIAHMDTSPESPGANVTLLSHDYTGGDIVLTPTVSIPAEDLAGLEGSTILSSDGETLLGGDDKAGCAAIVTAIEEMIDEDAVRPRIRLAFTPDEEIGEGTKNFDVEFFDAKYAFTIDGGKLGELEHENFNARQIVMNVTGINTHPGTAYDKMVNSIKVASEIISLLPRDESPEGTQGYEPYIHPNSIGDASSSYTTITFILRSFTDEGLVQMNDTAKNACEAVLDTTVYPDFDGATCEIVQYVEQYNNMGPFFDTDELGQEILDIARTAYNNLGITPIEDPIRGGTDGARLTEMGLPCPNLFTGTHNMHSLNEFVTYETMQKAVQVIKEIARLSIQ